MPGFQKANQDHIWSNRPNWSNFSLGQIPIPINFLPQIPIDLSHQRKKLQNMAAECQKFNLMPKNQKIVLYLGMIREWWFPVIFKIFEQKYDFQSNSYRHRRDVSLCLSMQMATA